jgi:hypothetical protein
MLRKNIIIKKKIIKGGGNMHKTFKFKLITIILATMFLINGILPTNVSFAGNKIDKNIIDNEKRLEGYAYMEVPPSVIGKEMYVVNIYTQELIRDYAENYGIYYEENGEYYSVDYDSEGKFYIENDPNKTYYWVSSIANPDYDPTTGVSSTITVSFANADNLRS